MFLFLILLLYAHSLVTLELISPSQTALFLSRVGFLGSLVRPVALGLWRCGGNVGTMLFPVLLCEELAYGIGGISPHSSTCQYFAPRLLRRCVSFKKPTTRRTLIVCMFLVRFLGTSNQSTNTALARQFWG